jgi:large repetitive protein
MNSLRLSLLLIVFASRCMASAVDITTASLPNGKVKTAYSAVIEASGGCTPYKWAIASGALPAGVTAKQSSTTTSLQLAGTPTTAATDSFVVEVTGCAGAVSRVSYKVVIDATAGPTITTSSLPNGTVDTAYSGVIQASGSCTPYKWAIASGALPAGITAEASSTTTSLHLAGTPTTAATDSFVVDVTGCAGAAARASYKVVIQPTANHVVDLSWKASTSAGIVGYNVYRGPNGTTWAKINPSLIGPTLYSDSTVANGSTYYYSTTAVNSSGDESSKSAPVEVVVP